MIGDRIDKEIVKNYLDRENPELAKKMQKNMTREDEWKDFKSELARRIASYAQNPTAKAREQLEDFVSSYSVNALVAQESLEKILKDLGIREKEVAFSRPGSRKTMDANRKAYLADLYRRAGLEKASFEIVEETEDAWQEKMDEKYGIVRQKGKKEKESPKGKDTKEDKVEKESKIKKAYYKLTSAMLMAPGKVPPEILAENRELLASASSKLVEVVEELKQAKKEIASKIDLKEVPEELKESYVAMSKDKMKEDSLGEFEEVLEQKQTQQLEFIRINLTYLQESKLKTSLKDFMKTNFPTMPEKEVAQEIEYIMKDAKVNKNGKLVLPRRSVMQEVIFDEKGEVLPAYKDLASSITTYRSAPKISELSDEQIQKVVSHLHDAKEPLEPDSEEFAVIEFLTEHTDMLPVDAEDRKHTIVDAFKTYQVVQNIAEEAEVRHKIILSEEIEEQLEIATEIVRRYDEREASKGELEETEAKSRADVLKIARQKVAALEKAGLSQVIEKGDRESKGVLEKAKSILLPHLQDARDKGTKKLDKEFERFEPKGSEEPEERD